jgi:hypothetical protein
LYPAQLSGAKSIEDAVTKLRDDMINRGHKALDDEIKAALEKQAILQAQAPIQA